MRKKLLSLAATLFVLLALTAATTAHAASVSTSRTWSPVYINDQQVSMAGYNINGNTYFKLRDLAAALSGTSSQFDVTWNQEVRQVEVLTGRPYSGPASDSSSVSSYATATLSTAALLIDGTAVDVKAYTIDGSNYYQLRDLGSQLPYEVYWLQESSSICVYTELHAGARLSTEVGGAARYRTAAESTARWGHTDRCYLFDNGDGTFSTVDVNSDNACTVDTFDSESCALLDSRAVPTELEYFGGFFAGEEYNYMVFGQGNKEEDDRKEVIRLVKYDKDFTRLDQLSITGGKSFTILPFEAGSVRMAEDGSDLVIHTARQRYTTSDGLNHQSQLTIFVDTDSMTVKNDLGQFQGNHVSHSFNQFVLYDGGKAVLVDHGDAYPRSVVLHKGNKNDFKALDLLTIPGTIGANCTGVTVGGLAVSRDNYLVAINTIDPKLASGYNSYTIEGLDRDERDVVLLVSGKNNSSKKGVEQVKLTDYIGSGKLGSTPYLVSLPGDRFLVLWEEFEYAPSWGTLDLGVRYVVVDGSGEPVTEVQSLPCARLSSDCQPVVVGSQVVWYVNAKAGRMFYRIEA